MTPQQIADKMNEYLREAWSDAYSLPALRQMAIRELYGNKPPFA